MAARNMFTPPLPSAQFNMAYAADLQRQQLAEDASYTQHLGFGGVAARVEPPDLAAWSERGWGAASLEDLDRYWADLPG
jgi:hypothetical protein